MALVLMKQKPKDYVSLQNKEEAKINWEKEMCVLFKCDSKNPGCLG